MVGPNLLLMVEIILVAVITHLPIHWNATNLQFWLDAIYCAPQAWFFIWFWLNLPFFVSALIVTSLKF